MGQQVSTFVNKAVTHIKEKVLDIARQILPPVARYVVEHPIQTALHVVNAVVTVLPGLIFPPLLSLAGFTTSGIAGGSLAAFVQSTIGAVTAGGMFATLQSATMGGYGVAAVAGVVSGTAMAVEATNIALEVARSKVEGEDKDG